LSAQAAERGWIAIARGMAGSHGEVIGMPVPGGAIDVSAAELFGARGDCRAPGAVPPVR
jgi:hypothetical protein